MKKLLALLLALCLLLPAGLAAAETVFPLSEEKITFRIATWQRSGQVDYNDMLMWQKYEEMTNVHIDWIHLPDSTFVERRNAMFTQDDLPDAIYRAKFSLSDVNKYAAEEMLLPLDDLVDNYAPNLQKFFAEYPQVRKALTMEDGHLYSLGYFNICDGLTVYTRQFLNMDWMNRLNLQVPTTIDEFTDVLRAFRDNDANGDGDPTNEIPLAGGNIENLLSTFYGSFGLQNRGPSQDWVDVDETTGSLRFWPTSEGYKKLMKTARLWYEEKLLDNEIFTTDSARTVANGTANLEGVWCAVNLTNVGGQAEKYAGLPAALIGPDGDQLYTNCKPVIYSPGSFVICDGAKNTETLIKWVDYFYSQEGAELLFLVDEKLYNTDENGVRSYNDYVTKNPDGLTLTQVISQNTCWSGGNCPAILLNNVFIGGETMPIPMAAAKAMLPYLPKEIWEPLFFTVDQNDEMTPILTDLSACVKEYRAAFIGGTKDIDAEWDNYVNEINKMRVDRYLEIVQESLDSHDADK